MCPSSSDASSSNRILVTRSLTESQYCAASRYRARAPSSAPRSRASRPSRGNSRPGTTNSSPRSRRSSPPTSRTRPKQGRRTSQLLRESGRHSGLTGRSASQPVDPRHSASVQVQVEIRGVREAVDPGVGDLARIAEASAVHALKVLRARHAPVLKQVNVLHTIVRQGIAHWATVRLETGPSGRRHVPGRAALVQIDHALIRAVEVRADLVPSAQAPAEMVPANVRAPAALSPSRVNEAPSAQALVVIVGENRASGRVRPSVPGVRIREVPAAHSVRVPRVIALRESSVHSVRAKMRVRRTIAVTAVEPASSRAPGVVRVDQRGIVHGPIAAQAIVPQVAGRDRLAPKVIVRTRRGLAVRAATTVGCRVVLTANHHLLGAIAPLHASAPALVTASALVPIPDPVARVVQPTTSGHRGARAAIPDIRPIRIDPVALRGLREVSSSAKLAPRTGDQVAARRVERGRTLAELDQASARVRLPGTVADHQAVAVLRDGTLEVPVVLPVPEQAGGAHLQPGEVPVLPHPGRVRRVPAG